MRQRRQGGRHHHGTGDDRGDTGQRGGNASQAYCDAAMAINTAGTAAGDPDADPVAFAKQLIGPAKTAAAVAPTEIADEYTTAINAMQAAIDGDSSKLAELDAAGAEDRRLQRDQLPVDQGAGDVGGLPLRRAPRVAEGR